ncbi:SDR family oxidoreductase [Streptomyces sp. NPDC088770]|uniref:SDR family oxidoreductase n=1 Tax=unclassified Streptomyces TaxID=2593676 RepID=UPI002DDB939C|nr:SDR family oxidoreductase [Streptomyces sp. NBC_01788]
MCPASRVITSSASAAYSARNNAVVSTARTPEPCSNRSPYATTKRGLIGLTETLAVELGDVGVRVNAIAPGAVAGERIQRVLQGRADASGRSLPDVTADALSIQSFKRFTDPDDIAALALFLASDSAKSITGQTIPIDGGSQAAQ